jgi:hypothetical protein
LTPGCDWEDIAQTASALFPMNFAAMSFTAMSFTAMSFTAGVGTTRRAGHDST